MQSDAIIQAHAPRQGFSGWLARGLFPLSLIGFTGAALYMAEAGMPLAWITMSLPLAVMILVGVMEWLLPFNRDWLKSKGDATADVSCFVVVVGFVESGIAALAPALAATVYIYLDRAGWLGAGFPAEWPLLLQVALLVAVSDLAKYWFHRFGHETDLGWRLHSVHHAVKRVYWFNGFRIHPLYHLINFLIAIFPWLCLGAPAEAIAVYSVILAVSAAFQHANIDLRNGWLNYVFNTNEVHRWHHSRVLDESNRNYGAVVLFWDLLFGTYRRPPAPQPAEIGIVDETHYPMHNYLKQLLAPFFWKSLALGQKRIQD